MSGLLPSISALPRHRNIGSCSKCLRLSASKRHKNPIGLLRMRDTQKSNSRRRYSRTRSGAPVSRAAGCSSMEHGSGAQTVSKLLLTQEDTLASSLRKRKGRGRGRGASENSMNLTSPASAGRANREASAVPATAPGTWGAPSPRTQYWGPSLRGTPPDH